MLDKKYASTRANFAILVSVVSLALSGYTFWKVLHSGNAPATAGEAASGGTGANGLCTGPSSDELLE